VNAAASSNRSGRALCESREGSRSSNENFFFVSAECIEFARRCLMEPLAPDKGGVRQLVSFRSKVEKFVRSLGE